MFCITNISLIVSLYYPVPTRSTFCITGIPLALVLSLVLLKHLHHGLELGFYPRHCGLQVSQHLYTLTSNTGNTDIPLSEGLTIGERPIPQVERITLAYPPLQAIPYQL
jgi:hypothetical protein